VQISRELGDARRATAALCNLANAVRARGDQALAHAMLMEALATFRELGDRVCQASTLNHALSTPNKLFECLAAGVPVVASDLPEMRRIVVGDPDGPLGELCDPSSAGDVARAIARLLAMPPAEMADLRARCLRAAHERWNWETESARLVELYSFRDPLYREVAASVVESNREEIAHFSRRLEAALQDPLQA